MERFTASRLTAGNRIFPAQLQIDETGVTLKQPSLFSRKETTVPYSRIASVNIECPAVGFSTIYIQTTGYREFVTRGTSSWVQGCTGRWLTMIKQDCGSGPQ